MSFRALKRRLLRRLGILPPKYKSFVGDARNYDALGRNQFENLKFWGMGEENYLLDIGCGSLTGGRFAIKFLAPGHYYGIEPQQWLIDEGCRNELGAALAASKRPSFSNDATFKLSLFGRSFDFLVAHSILSHTSQEQMRALFSEAAKVMSATSIFLATYLHGENDYTGSQWVYPGVTRYRFATIEALAAHSGLKCSPCQWPHPGNQRWLVFYCEGNAEFVGTRLRALIAADGGSLPSSTTVPN